MKFSDREAVKNAVRCAARRTAGQHLRSYDFALQLPARRVASVAAAGHNEVMLEEDPEAPSGNQASISQQQRLTMSRASTSDKLKTLAPAAHFVVISKFAIANDMSLQVKEAFRNRPHKVDSADGFLRMEVISPVDDPSEIWLMTFWRDESSFKTWHHSHLYRESHAGIPKGLKLNPKSVSIRCFDGVSS